MPREQRLVFGEVADTYQQARPSYPSALFDAIVELAGLTAGDRVLDVGAGTGKATESLVARGFKVTAVEPSPEMAAVLRARLPEVTVHGCSLEDWPVERQGFAVVTAGQSWHWVDAGIGAARAADALRPRGWIALFWNRPALHDCEWHDELQPIYERIAPDLTHDRLARRWAPARDQIDKLLLDERFGPPVVRESPWSERYSTAAYITLLGTHSDHRLLPDAQRAELHGAIAESINACGGEIDHPYVTDLIAAPVR